MKSYKITRKRMVVQHATFVIEVDGGLSPLDEGEKVEVTDWTDVNVSKLSTEVEPVNAE